MKIKKATILTIIIIFFVVILTITIFNCGRSTSLYQTFNSPDGQFILEVYSFDSNMLSLMPGQGGDAPGVVFLKNKSGHILQKCNVEMVQLVDSPEWNPDSVKVKLIFDWKLPVPDKRN